MTRKILGCGMESFAKNISKLRKLTFTFKNFQENFEKRKKKLKTIHMDS